MEKETNMPTSIQQRPPLPPQKNIKNVILVEVTHEIKEVINEAVEKNDSNRKLKENYVQCWKQNAKEASSF